LLVAIGQTPKPTEVSVACRTTIHAARAAVRRYKSGIVPLELPPGLAPKTVRNIHAMIHRALVDAVAWKYIAYNPASSIKPPKRPRKRRTVWNPDQIQTFLTAVQRDRFAALFLLELTTGIRRGQICGLRWSAIDLDAGEITIHDNRVVVGGRARDKAGGKTQNADKTTSIARPSPRSAGGVNDRTASESSSAAPITAATTCSPSRTGGHHTPTRLGNDSTAWRQPRGYPGSRFTICVTPTRQAPSKPLWIRRSSASESGTPTLDFFLQIYAHVLKNDDRDAAEQAASFLIGDDWASGSDDEAR
jgi:hypothetical protein